MADKRSSKNILIRALFKKDKTMIKEALFITKPIKFLVFYHKEGKIFLMDNVINSLGSNEETKRELTNDEAEILVNDLSRDYDLRVIDVRYK